MYQRKAHFALNAELGRIKSNRERETHANKSRAGDQINNESIRADLRVQWPIATFHQLFFHEKSALYPRWRDASSKSPVGFRIRLADRAIESHRRLHTWASFFYIYIPGVLLFLSSSSVCWRSLLSASISSDHLMDKSHPSRDPRATVSTQSTLSLSFSLIFPAGFLLPRERELPRLFSLLIQSKSAGLTRRPCTGSTPSPALADAAALIARAASSLLTVRPIDQRPALVLLSPALLESIDSIHDRIDRRPVVTLRAM